MPIESDRWNSLFMENDKCVGVPYLLLGNIRSLRLAMERRVVFMNELIL